MLSVSLVICLCGQFNIQTAIDTSIKGPERDGGIVQIPEGIHVVTDSIRITSVKGLKLIGAGKGATKIRWNGPANKPVFLLDDTYHCVFQDFQVDHYGPCTAAFEIVNGPGNVYIPSACHFENINIGLNQPQMDYCFNIWNAITAGNNELHSWERCDFSGYKKSAVRVSGSQIHKLFFLHCQMLGYCGPETVGVDCEYGSYIHWIGGSGGYNKKWDFRFQNFVVHNKIDGWNSEGSGGLVEVTQSGSNPAPLTVVDCRFEGATNGGAVVAGHNPGPLTMTGNVISDPSGNPTVFWGNYGGITGGQLNVHGNAIYAKTAYSKTTKRFLVTNEGYDTNYSGNSFYSMEPGAVNPNRGDQDILTNGFPVATKDQGGIVTTTTQEFSGRKDFLNDWDKQYGITLSSVHNDGRMRLGAKTGGGSFIFWNRYNRVDCEGDFTITNNFTANTVSLGVFPGYAATAGGTNQLKVRGTSGSGTNSVIDLWTTRYAVDNGPRTRYTSTSHEFIVNDGSSGQTFNPGTGTQMLHVSPAGVKIGQALLTPTADGDVLIKLGTKQKTLSSLLGP